MSHGISPLLLPGYGLPIHWTPAPCSKTEMEARMENGETEESMFRGPPLFPTAWHLCAEAPDDDIRMPLITKLEAKMIEFMNAWTDKLGWEELVMNPVLVKDWHAKQNRQERDWPFSEETLEYVIQELQYKARIFKKTGFITVAQGDIVKSDVAIPKGLKERLKVAVASLEDDLLVASRNGRIRRDRPGRVMKDFWHISEIVDPTFNPVLYGRTKILVDSVLDKVSCLGQIGAGSIIPAPEGAESLYALSGKVGPGKYEYRGFNGDGQLLPCDVDISGGVPRILTYINNVHPVEHAALYTVIEEVLAKVMPAWSMTLGPLRTFDFDVRVKYDGPEYGELEEWVKKNEKKKNRSKKAEGFDRALEHHISRRKVFYQPPQVRSCFKEPIPTQLPNFDLKELYKDRGLQIIVRMRSFHLTPTMVQNLKPRDRERLEGLPNDHICAIAHYYYDVENIDIKEQLKLFQPEKANPVFKEGNVPPHHGWFLDAFGLKYPGWRAKCIASIDTLEGRLITFPHLLFQEQKGLCLIDKTKKGHCKMLTLFLVDPNIRLISSANVPCQQYDWWVREVIADQGGLGGLPYELRLEIMKYIPFYWGERYTPELATEDLHDSIFHRTRHVHFEKRGN